MGESRRVGLIGFSFGGFGEGCFGLIERGLDGGLLFLGEIVFWGFEEGLDIAFADEQMREDEEELVNFGVDLDGFACLFAGKDIIELGKGGFEGGGERLVDKLGEESEDLAIVFTHGAIHRQDARDECSLLKAFPRLVLFAFFEGSLGILKRDGRCFPHPPFANVKKADNAEDHHPQKRRHPQGSQPAPVLPSAHNHHEPRDKPQRQKEDPPRLFHDIKE